MIVTLNGIDYVLADDGRRAPVRSSKLPPFADFIPNVGPARPTHIPGRIALAFPNLSHGFGRDRIDSDSAHNVDEYRRFYDSTLDTRFVRDVRLPILEEDSTEMTINSGTPTLIPRASATLGSDFFVLSEYAAAAKSTYVNKYDGSSTAWTGSYAMQGAPATCEFTVDAGNVPDGMTITININGVAIVLTEGTHWDGDHASTATVAGRINTAVSAMNDGGATTNQQDDVRVDIIPAAGTISLTLATSNDSYVDIVGGGSGPNTETIKTGHDMILHKDKLIALYVDAGSHNIMFSSNGTSWSNPAADLTGSLMTGQSAGDDDDAGLLAEIGGEAVAAIWHEANATITFFSSTNAGNNWTDENIDISSAGGPTGIAVNQGIDNEDKLYVGTREGLYEVDTSTSTWTFRMVFPMVPHADNCRRMKMHSDGALWFAQGVDDDSPPTVYRMFVTNGARKIERVPNDFSMGDSLPAARLGPIRWMESAQGMMYVSMGGGKAGRFASIMAHNGKGWHSVRAHGTANQKIQWIGASGYDDATPRLHYSVRTAVNTTNTKFLGQPFVNPSSGVTIKRESSGYVDLPYLDAGFLETGTWLKYSINAEDLTSSTSNEYIAVTDGIDASGALQARTSNARGNILSTASSLDLASGAGVASVNLGSRLTLHRGSTNTNTPKLKDTRVSVIKEPSASERFEFAIDIDATAKLNGIADPEVILTNLNSARDLTTLPAFSYGASGTKYVKVRTVEKAEYFSDENVSGAVAARAQTRRGGIVQVVVEEVA